MGKASLIKRMEEKHAIKYIVIKFRCQWICKEMENKIRTSRLKRMTCSYRLLYNSNNFKFRMLEKVNKFISYFYHRTI